MKILFEDKDIIVCRKPPGMPVQTKEPGVPDMVSELKNIICEKGKKSEPYIGLIHRLDQVVEGLMVFGKTPYSSKELSRQLGNKTIGKYYYGVTKTIPKGCKEFAYEYSLIDYIVKDGRSNRSYITNASVGNAKKGGLLCKIVGEEQGRYLLDIHLITGRHHQIRVQLAHRGAPLIGDRKYGNDTEEKTVALCAYKLCFLHPKTKEKMEFQIGPSLKIFQQFL